MKSDSFGKELGCFTLFFIFVIVGLSATQIADTLTVISFYGFEQYSNGLHVSNSKTGALSNGKALSSFANVVRIAYMLIWTIVVVVIVKYILVAIKKIKVSTSRDVSNFEWFDYYIEGILKQSNFKHFTHSVEPEHQGQTIEYIKEKLADSGYICSEHNKNFPINIFAIISDKNLVHIAMICVIQEKLSENFIGESEMNEITVFLKKNRSFFEKSEKIPNELKRKTVLFSCGYIEGPFENKEPKKVLSKVIEINQPKWDDLNKAIKYQIFVKDFYHSLEY